LTIEIDFAKQIIKKENWKEKEVSKNICQRGSRIRNARNKQ